MPSEFGSQNLELNLGSWAFMFDAKRSIVKGPNFLSNQRKRAGWSIQLWMSGDLESRSAAEFSTPGMWVHIKEM